MKKKFRLIGVICNFSKESSIEPGRVVFDQLIRLLLLEGKEIKCSDNYTVVFDNGDMVQLIDTGKDVLLEEEEYTHLFVDIYDPVHRGALLEVVVPEGKYVSLNAKGSRRRRVSFFNREGIIV